MKYLIFTLTILCHVSFAQSTLTGTIKDGADDTSLIGVSVLLSPASDTTQRRGVVTDTDGRFQFKEVRAGKYILKISYIGYTSFQVEAEVKDTPMDLGSIRMKQSSITLKGVEVKATSIQVEQKGDTLQYNAGAFKTNRDATAEDLIGKLPGMTSDGTGVKAQGEAVQQVLVDGKQFFGDDAALALKNLPAEIIDKIEVFDRMSEQSQFTGFDDGQTRKTVNIVTKKGKNNGQFGRVYAGGGEDGRYLAGGNINSFNGNRKVSLVGLSNNINQQNFSNEDLLGVSNSSGAQGGRGGRGQRGGGGNNNFGVGQQSGISKTHSIGLNYSNEWGTKTEISGSYFFNQADNERFTDLSRLYITQQDSGLLYHETSRANSTNDNHRFNVRVEYNIDTANSIVITPRFSFQRNDSKSLLNGDYSSDDSSLESRIDNRNDADNAGYSFSTNVLYRHRFKKRGRSFSLNVSTDVNDRDGDSYLRSLNEYESSGETTLLDQRADQFTNSFTVSTNLSYTEPVGKRGQLQFNYTPSVTKSKTDKKTYDLDPETSDYTALDTALTNTFENKYITNRGGVSYRHNNKKYNFNAGINYQHAKLNSDQDFPYVFQVNRSFQNMLPQFMLNYKFSQTENIRIQYRASTNAPSVSQLQNVIDNRNPLFLKTGNPALSQDYSNNVSIRYGKTNVNTSTSFLILLNGNFVTDYITNASYIATQDTVFNDVALVRGTQLSYPVNISGYRNARTLVTYGMPVKLLKSNVNLNTGFTYNRIPALINNNKNLANNFAISQGVVLSSNVSEDLDFTVSYTANYTIVKNSIQKQSDNNYFNQSTSLKLNWIFLKGFVFTTNLNNTLYRGLSSEFDQSFWFWNAGLGYKFLKDQALEVKINAFDILNQNNSISRDITETYIEDRRTNVLTRYFMVTATYTIRKFR
jgi:hypothetical protein